MNHYWVRLLFIVLGISTSVLADPVQINYQLGRVHGFMVFVESISGGSHGVTAFRDQFEKSPYFGQPEIRKLLEELKVVSRDLMLTYQFPGFPASRNIGQQIQDLYSIQSMQSKDLKELKSRTMGLIPISQQQKLFEILEKLEPIYEELIWKKYHSKLKQYQSQLERVGQKAKVEDLFDAAVRFYGAEWPKGVPFQITLYPISDQKVNSRAQSFENFESVGVLIGEKGIEGRLGVVFHEICHSIYNAQPADFQKMIDQRYRNSKSTYAQFAYDHLNEALATALGNGWAFEKATGMVDPVEWYNDDYVEGFARALYPLVKKYVEQKMTLNDAFIDQSIEIFAKTFPHAPEEFNNLFRSVTMVSSERTKAHELARTLRERFRVSSMSRMHPIDDPENVQYIQENNNSLIIIFPMNEKAKARKLLDAVQGLTTTYKKQSEKMKDRQILLGKTKQNRLVIMVSANDEIGVEKVWDLLVARKIFDPQKALLSY